MKYLILLCLLACSQFLPAQEAETPRSWILGGSLSFSTQNNYYPYSLVDVSIGSSMFIGNNSDDANSTTFTVRPYFGKQISNRLLAGLLFDYRVSSYTATVISTFPQSMFDYKTTSNQYGIGLFARYSFAPASRFDFFLQPFAHYHIATEDEFIDDNQTSEEKAGYIAVGSDLGVLYNISDRWRATARAGGLTYINGSWDRVGTSSGNDFSSLGFNFNLSSIHFGVELKL